MYPLLDRNDVGDIVIRWPLFLKGLAIALACGFGGMFLGQYLVGREFRITSYLTFAVAVTFGTLALLYVKKRQAEGRSVRQFSLLAVFVFISAISILFAIMGVDRQYDLQKNAERLRLQKQLDTLIGAGSAHVSSSTSIQVKRATFNDADLVKIVNFSVSLEKAGAPLTILDLSGTSVTDQGVSALSKISTLEFCFLNGTAITDASLNVLGKLPNLKILQAISTGVTPDAVSKLRAARPDLDIEPKTFPQAAMNAGSAATKTPGAVP